MKRNGVIVFDLDGTFWQREVRTGSRILTPGTAPDISLLIQLLEADFIVAVCSGNAATHVIRVLVRPLLKSMYEQGKLELAQDFYAFFQLGGGLARFDSGRLRTIQNAKDWAKAESKLFRSSGLEFHPDHVDGHYVGLQSIDVKAHGKMLNKLLEAARDKNQQLQDANRKYYGHPKSSDPDFASPKPQLRRIRLSGRNNFKVVQYTLKPLYSEKHYTKVARTKGLKYQDSIRYQVAKFMNDRLEQAGVGLTATAAGATSVDITNHDLSKTTAIEYLRTILHEHHRNILYFGDEFHLGGNDVVVPLDLQITSFSVGKGAIFHPCVFAAPKPGPQGTFAVLHSLLGFSSSHRGKNSAIDAFREDHSRQIVVQKLANLSAETLQTLAIIATAGSRDRNFRELQQLFAEQVRSRHEDQRPPGASHWTDSL